jgi:hypothetical protein
LLSREETFWFAINASFRKRRTARLQQRTFPNLGVVDDA